jgi:DNA modification methylase
MSFSHTEGDWGRLYHGDCLEVMKSLPDQSIDAVVTDPP